MESTVLTISLFLVRTASKKVGLWLTLLVHAVLIYVLKGLTGQIRLAREWYQWINLG
jgi:hypothetical protein